MPRGSFPHSEWHSRPVGSRRCSRAIRLAAWHARSLPSAVAGSTVILPRWTSFEPVDTATVAMKEFVVPDHKLRSRRIEVAPDGMVYFTDYSRGYLGRLDSTTGQFQQWPSPGGDKLAPYGFAYAADGRIWYNKSGTGELVAFDPKTEKMETVKIPTSGSVVRNVSVDEKRRIIWLAESGLQRLGKLELGGK
jgi:virginiamycin B lyase